MELTPLKYFVKLADVLSFTEASKELFITQSTLSLSIKQLEEELGGDAVRPHREENLSDGCRTGFFGLFP